MPARVADERSRIIEKIQQLLALTQSSNEHEAAVAASKVQELLIKYNLSEEAILEDGPVSIPTRDYYVAGKISQDWEKSLVGSVSKMLFCRSVFEVGSNVFHITGRVANLDVAIRTLDFLFEELSRLVKQAEESYVDGYIQNGWIASRGAVYRELHGARHPYAYRTSWLRGAATGIVKQMMEARGLEDENARAIVLLRDNEMEDVFAELYPKLRRVPLSKVTNSTAYAVGYVTGKQMNLEQRKELK